jgi:hypothetical protein
MDDLTMNKGLPISVSVTAVHNPISRPITVAAIQHGVMDSVAFSGTIRNGSIELLVNE